MSGIGNIKPDIVLQIKKFIDEKKEKSVFGYNEIIRDDVFAILEKQSSVIYYPLDDEENDGFHVYYPVNNAIESFVFINTAKFIEKQIFTAAHELGHILKLEDYLEHNCVAYDREGDEYYVNRFAAELLIPEEFFKKVIAEKIKDVIADNSISLSNLYRLIVYLMDFFYVPFKTIVYRLYECHYIDEKTKDSIIADEVIVKSDTYPKNIQRFIEEGKYLKLQQANKKKEFSDLAKLLQASERKNIFSKEKITNIRKLFDIPSLSDVKDSSIPLSEGQNVK